MKRPWRHPLFIRAYEHLPHPWIDALAGRVMRMRPPRWLVRSLIATWVRRARIGLHDFEPGPFPTLEAFFLRQLRPGARPLQPGLVAPVDGVVTSVGRARPLVVKGHTIDSVALTGDAAAAFRSAIVIFLSPDGYHHIHAPADARVVAIRRIEGRSFPQNDDALAVRPDVYLRNARVVVSTTDYTLVLVGASLVSDVVLDVAAGAAVHKGDVLGHFRFGSTVALLSTADITFASAPGVFVRVGQTLVPGTVKTSAGGSCSIR